jgi:hypothetical protein
MVIVLENFCVPLWLLLGDFRHSLDETSNDDILDLAEESIGLERLTRNIEWEVVCIDEDLKKILGLKGEVGRWWFERTLIQLIHLGSLCSPKSLVMRTRLTIRRVSGDEACADCQKSSGLYFQ